MATRTKTRLYDWGDGKGAVHTIPKEQRDENARAKRTPLPPPPGTYDPDFDAQLGKAQRDLVDLQGDTTYGRAVALSDEETGLAAINTGSGRSLADLLAARARGETDYQTQGADLTRGYQNLAGQQRGQAYKAGVEGGGAMLQSAAKRTANEARARSAIDEAHRRFQADSQTAEGRINEDKQTAIGGLSTDILRRQTALGTALERAEKEMPFYESDIAAAKQAQARTPLITATPRTVAVTSPFVTQLAAGADIKGTKKKRKGRTVTYSAAVGGP